MAWARQLSEFVHFEAGFLYSVGPSLFYRTEWNGIVLSHDFTERSRCTTDMLSSSAFSCSSSGHICFWWFIHVNVSADEFYHSRFYIGK